ncbi:hypothetical protein H0H93_007785 [Arthromyces matolae]|nr:hypothetical protein H0H93_007785 [Arthromyces matolae]
MTSCSLGTRIDRCLSYDEKSFLLFQKLKDAKKNTVSKDIRSPISVAQQKHAARKASSVISADSTMTSATNGHSKTHSSSRTNRPSRLEVQDLSAPAPPCSRPDILRKSPYVSLSHLQNERLGFLLSTSAKPDLEMVQTQGPKEHPNDMVTPLEEVTTIPESHTSGDTNVAKLSPFSIVVNS